MNDESLELETTKLQAEVNDLATKHEEARLKFEAGERRWAHYFRLLDEKKRLEHEIAAMEGRPYHDDEDDED